MKVWDFHLVGALLLISHLGVASTSARKLLVRYIGEKRYLILFSLLAMFLLSYFVWLYSEVSRFQYFWLPDPDAYWLAKLTMPLACVLLVGAFMVKNPSSVGGSLGEEEDISVLVRGVVCITRHPLQWAILLWGVGHVVANGDHASVFFFSIFIFLSGAGTFLLDLKKAKEFGDSWDRYQSETSNFPFLALIEGRTTMRVKELYLPVFFGLIAYVLMYYFHESVTGAIVF